MTRSWMAPLGLAASAVGLAVAYAVAPDSTRTEWVAALGALLALVAVLVGLVTDRPVHSTPWLALVVGAGCWVSAGVLSSVETYAGDRVHPGIPEVVVALGFPWMLVGVIGLTSPTRRVRDLLAGSESLIGGLAASTVLWILLVGPGGGVSVRSLDAWVVAFVALDVVLVAVAVRAAVTSPGERVRYAVVALAFAAAGIAHAALDVVVAAGGRTAGGPWAAVSLLTPMLIGVAALVPVTHAPEIAPEETATVKWSRVAVLTGVAVLPSLVLALGALVDADNVSSTEVASVAVATAALFVLVVVRIWGMVVQVRDLSERRAQVRLAALVEYSNDVVMIVDESGAVTYASPGLLGSLGHPPDQWIGRRFVDIAAVDDRPGTTAEFTALLSRGRDATAEFEAVLVRADGEERHGDVVMVNLLGDDAVNGLVVTFRDITEQRDLERRLSHRAFHDELTGLANRALFLDRMNHALSVHRADSDPVMVLFIDLDDFKVINDVHGHATGDHVLRSLAQRIRGVVGTTDTVARLGGDEFAILLEEHGGIDRAIDVAEQLLAELKRPMRIGADDAAILASVGVAVAPGGATTTSVLRDADIAMYEAKRAGKGQIRIFDPAMRRLARRHLVYRSELASAIAAEQLRVVYQPYVDLRTGEVRGAEALVRWRHPDLGDVSPAEFVPIAERSGMMIPIGRWVLGEALDQFLRWRQDADLFVSVNLSTAELRDDDAVEHVVRAIADRGLDPGVLVVEVNETALMEDAERSTLNVAALRDHGVRVALDDFGAGYGSLSFLQRHPVDFIKVDRSVIADLGHRAVDSGDAEAVGGDTLARTIVQMSGVLGLRSVAEGIETTAQLRELRLLGCDLGQGHLLSAPMEADAAVRRFAAPLVRSVS